MTHVLFVCTANLCRSPLAAELLCREAARRDLEVTAASAGLLDDGAAPGHRLVATASEHDLDLAAHRSHRVRVEDVRAADLVLTMEHYQVGDVARLEREAWNRTFTLKEAVRRAERVGARARDEPFGDWLRRLGAGRRRVDLVGARDLDVTDPVGTSTVALDDTLDELADLVPRFATAAWPSSDPTAGRRRRLRRTRR